MVVEGNTCFAHHLELPVQPRAAAGSSATIPAAVYELSAKALRWEEGAPQAVLRYEFRGSNPTVGSGRLGRWFGDRRHRVARWMMAPVSYPMTTRSERLARPE
jgi:hypothetical protein